MKKLIAKHQPDIVFLMETKQLSSNTNFLKNFMDTYSFKIVDCSTTGGGKAGGLTLLWNNCNMHLNIIDCDLNYIDCLIHNASKNIHFIITAVILIFNNLEISF
jgi:hypothetical protein